jgi:pyruvate dehydrogenase E2 component (dihydrolipoamide acetyltransferase)
VIDVTMPRLSDSMEEGTILKWLVEDGAAVKRGDELAEIETDKAAMTYEADADGVFHRVAAEGDALPVGAVIARLLADGETAPVDGAPAAAPAGPVAESPVPAGERPGTADSAPPAGPETAAPAGAATAVAPSQSAVGDGSAPGARIKASPLARRIARQLGVELHTVAGTGAGGRIVRADVEHAAAAGANAPAGSVAAAADAPTAAASLAPGASASASSPPTTAAAPAAGAAKGDVEVVQLSSVQKTIARRMAEAKATIPDFQVRTEVDVTDLLKLRAAIKAQRDAAPSVNDFVIKACGLALREHPRANGAYKDGTFELYGRVNVGVAVAAEGSLIVPTIFDADAKPVTQISSETRALAGKVREGTIVPPELAGGTFTVSNLGMFGVTSFTAGINPGQAAILAVGAAVARPALDESGAPVLRQLMDLSLSCDHRILYGADAAQFLARIRELLERPLALLT